MVQSLLKLGIIGLGKMGLLHAGIHSAIGTPITAICEKESLILKLARKTMPGLRFYDDYEEMVRAETLDGVIITTPVQSHASILLDLLTSNQNLSYFVEKPLGATQSESRKICDTSRAAKGVQMVGYQKRYAPTFAKAKEIIQNKELGSIQVFTAHIFSSDVTQPGEGWRLKKGSGGVVVDLGPHLIDLVLWYFGEPSKITSFTKSIYSQVEDYAHAVMQFQDGLLGEMDISWSVRGFRLPSMSLHIEGSNGVLTVNDDMISISLDRDGKRLPAGNRLYRRPEMAPSVSFLLGDPEYTLEDQAFRDAIASKKSPESDFDSGFRTDQIITRILTK